MGKYILIIVCLFSLLFTGCKFITTQIVGDDQVNPFIGIAARRMAYKVTQNNPEKVDYLINKCDDILNKEIEDSYPLLEEAIRYAVDKYTSDPMLYDDLFALAKFYQVDLKQPVVNLDMGMIRSFLEGVRIFKDTLQRYKTTSLEPDKFMRYAEKLKTRAMENRKVFISMVGFY